MASQVITPRGAEIMAGRVPFAPTARLGALLTRFSAWLERGRRYRRTVAELSALDDQTLADIGVQRGQIRGLALHLAAAPRR